jgi:glutamate N-acetyltransferase/amino-acid N-acetyltransferase
MLGPRMATLLGLLLTAARLTADSAQHLLAEVVEQTFNCVSVEGHTSTNDTVLLLASGHVGQEPLRGKSLQEFQTALVQLCIELAKSVANDGEGATHLIEIHVTGCTDHGSARQIARTIAESPLVKTAVAGADPNWGRIVSAAGYAGPPLDISQTRLEVNGFVLFDRGGPVPFDRQDVSQSIKANRDTSLCLQVGSGPGHACFWTCDLTTEYVHINADYHT